MLGWLRENSGSLVLSILLSLTIWIVAVQQQNPIEQRDFPEILSIRDVGLPPTLVVSEDHVRTARLSLRAPQSTWNTLTAEDITIVADLANLSAGEHEVQLKVTFAQRIKATNVKTNPETITVSLEELRQREIPVRVNSTGQLPVGFSAEEPQVEPASVTLSGPTSLVDLVSEVSVTVSLDDKRSTIETELVPIAVDSEGRLVQGLETTSTPIRVTIPIVQKPDFKEVTIIARQRGTPARGYYLGDIIVTPLAVTLQGPPDVLNQMPDFIEAPHIDLTNATENFTSLVELALPEGVVVAGNMPVEVQVEIEAFQGSVAIQRIPEVVGLSEELQATIAPETVNLILSGSVPVLDNLNEQDIRVVVDVTDLEPGTYQLAPQVIILIEGITSQTLLPATVDVEIT